MAFITKCEICKEQEIRKYADIVCDQKYLCFECATRYNLNKVKELKEEMKSLKASENLAADLLQKLTKKNKSLLKRVEIYKKVVKYWMNLYVKMKKRYEPEIMAGQDAMKTCECGNHIFADTEDWEVPVCHSCYVKLKEVENLKEKISELEEEIRHYKFRLRWE